MVVRRNNKTVHTCHKWVLLICVLLVSRNQADDSLPGASLPPALNSLPDSLIVQQDSLGADSIQVNLVEGKQKLPRQLGQPWPIIPATLSPVPLPGLGRADRAAEDLADRLLKNATGPLEDLAQISHPQYLALDGLDSRSMRLDMEGEALHNRLTGLSDLRWLSAEMLQDEELDLWGRSASAGGTIHGTWPRAGDSVFVRVNWADGFLGLVRNDIRASRPLGKGGIALGTRQVYTHERVPGARIHENLFWGYWEHPLPGDWHIRLDKRLLREKGFVLDHRSQQRRMFQNLNRARVWQLASQWPFRLALDAQRRWDREDFSGESGVDLRSEFRRLEVHLLSGNGLWRDSLSALKPKMQLAIFAEHQLFDADSLDKELSDFGASFSWRTQESAVLQSLVSAKLAQRDDSGLRSWNLAVEFGGMLSTPVLNSWQIVLARGQSLPWPDQLWITRYPGEANSQRNPFLRQSGGAMLPNAELGSWHWFRQELRLGGQFKPWNLPEMSAQLRFWRVTTAQQPLALPHEDGPDYRWTAVDRQQLGQQLFVQSKLTDRWSLEFAQAWFPEESPSLSREYPTTMLDFSLHYDRRFFGQELLVQSTLGLHHESGAVGSASQNLWEAPKTWLHVRATRGHFTLWWAVQNPMDYRLERIEGRPLFGHEEWLGVRWDFLD